MERSILKHFKFLIYFFMLSCIFSVAAYAQEEEELDPMRFYRAKYDLNSTANVNIVAEAVAEVIESTNCAVIQNISKTDNDGYVRFIIKSDYCVFVEGEQTFDTLQFYSNKMPFIRGGTWENGRMQYKLVITEQPDGSTYLLLKGTLSGFENNVTNKVHFWESNGMFEHNLLLAIEEKIKEKLGN